jgi:hypothetical protein
MGCQRQAGRQRQFQTRRRLGKPVDPPGRGQLAAAKLALQGQRQAFFQFLGFAGRQSAYRQVQPADRFAERAVEGRRGIDDGLVQLRRCRGPQRQQRDGFYVRGHRNLAAGLTVAPTQCALADRQVDSATVYSGREFHDGGLAQR